ncbi:unnamed protein product [Boreogadus saida]
MEMEEKEVKMEEVVVEEEEIENEEVEEVLEEEVELKKMTHVLISWPIHPLASTSKQQQMTHFQECGGC